MQLRTTKKLDENQVARFNIFGFLSFPGLLVDCVDKIITAFEDVWASNGGGHYGKQHDGKLRSVIFPFADQNEFLSSLLDDPRIHDIASTLCGEDFNYTSGDGNYYTGDTVWHSDGYNTRSGIPSFKMAFYLDSVKHDTGALRVIPGSHRIGEPFADALEENVKRSGRTLGLLPREIPSVTLESNPGDVLVFNHNIKHSSFGGSQNRRMFTMNFSERYPDDKLETLREQLGQEARFWIDRIHGDIMIRTATPERMVHLQQIRENDTHLVEISRRLRETMSEPARG